MNPAVLNVDANRSTGDGETCNSNLIDMGLGILFRFTTGVSRWPVKEKKRVSDSFESLQSDRFVVYPREQFISSWESAAFAFHLSADVSCCCATAATAKKPRRAQYWLRLAGLRRISNGNLAPYCCRYWLRAYIEGKLAVFSQKTRATHTKKNE